jgi:alanine racemase
MDGRVRARIPLEWRSWAEIDRGALRANLAAVRGRIPRGCGIMPAVKANAYGHGVEIVAPEWEARGAAWFGVANLDEALELRRIGVKAPVLLLSACLEPEWAGAVRGRFALTVSTPREVQGIARAARRQRRVAEVHAKIDTGMGRLGAWHEDAAPLLEAIAGERSVRLGAVMSHFASADSDARFTREQWRRLQPWRRPGVPVHMANSAGLLTLPAACGDLVRPGIALYGYAPMRKERAVFRPVLTWKARVTLERWVGVGRTLSYGATHRTRRRTRVAAVSAGYADGYPRILSGAGSVLVRGQRCAVLGRVTMDQILVDVTRVTGVAPGWEVELLGPGVRADEVAAQCGTISYELLTGISERVKRVAV